MNKKIIFPILTSALLLSGCNNLSFPTPEEGFEDNTKYDDPLVVSLDNPSFLLGEDSEDGGESTDPEEPSTSPTKLTIHYHNDDSKTSTRAFYIWNEELDGKEYEPDFVSADGKDMYKTWDFTEEGMETFLNQEVFTFIIKYKGTWTGQSEDLKLSYTDFPPNEDGLTEVWCIPGTGTSVEMYATEEETKQDNIQSAYFLDWKTIECVATAVPNNVKLYAYDAMFIYKTDYFINNNKESKVVQNIGTPTCTTFTKNGVTFYKFKITLKYVAHLNVQYLVEGNFESKPELTKKAIVSYENLYDLPRFEKYFTYKGDLGAIYSKEQTIFRVWAPTAATIFVNLYDKGGTPALQGTNEGKAYQMVYQPGGIYELTITGDLNGKYYTYTVYNSAGKNEVIDPYAKGCGINGLRGYIYDPNGANVTPDGWNDVSYNKLENGPQDLCVYEVHIRDLTADSTWSSSKKTPRGTFNAFSEAGTVYYYGGKPYKTGFDHIEDLGVNAIQILPAFDGENNEVPGKTAYNWGYNPLNYNCVEGAYSTNPYDGAVRIKEYRNLVMNYANNKNNTRVIMDVVYNHVSSASSSSFTKLMPRYYFRYDSEWNYLNGSGCANEVRSEATMMRKFIVDSVCFWATTYKIKGFRFDLMGLLDVETTRQAKDNLYVIDPDIYVYGEGWRGDGDGSHGKGSSAETGNIYSMLYPTASSPGLIGAFNDSGRNALRGGNDGGWGSNSHYPGWGFIAQSAADVGSNSTTVADMMMGIHTGKGGNPVQTINYASCHDNYTLWDQLMYTEGDYTGVKSEAVQDDETYKPSINKVVHASLAAHATIILSNGVAFIQGGEELYRTKIEAEETDYTVKIFGKNICHNSYKSSDSTNSFKWDRLIKVDGTDVSNYLQVWKDMIAARKAMSKYQYDSSWTNSTSDTHCYWGADSSSTFGGKIGNYYFAIAGRQAGSVTMSSASSMTQLFNTNSVDSYTTSSTKVTLPALTFVCWKKN